MVAGVGPVGQPWGAAWSAGSSEPAQPCSGPEPGRHHPRQDEGRRRNRDRGRGDAGEGPPGGGGGGGSRGWGGGCGQPQVLSLPVGYPPDWGPSRRGGRGQGARGPGGGPGGPGGGRGGGGCDGPGGGLVVVRAVVTGTAAGGAARPASARVSVLARSVATGPVVHRRPGASRTVVVGARALAGAGGGGGREGEEGREGQGGENGEAGPHRVGPFEPVGWCRYASAIAGGVGSLQCPSGPRRRPHHVRGHLPGRTARQVAVRFARARNPLPAPAGVLWRRRRLRRARADCRERRERVRAASRAAGAVRGGGPVRGRLGPAAARQGG